MIMMCARRHCCAGGMGVRQAGSRHKVRVRRRQREGDGEREKQKLRLRQRASHRAKSQGSSSNNSSNDDPLSRPCVTNALFLSLPPSLFHPLSAPLPSLPPPLAPPSLPLPSSQPPAPAARGSSWTTESTAFTCIPQPTAFPGASARYLPTSRTRGKWCAC